MSQDHEAAQQHTTQPQETHAEPLAAGLEGLAAPDLPIGLPGTLLDNPHISGRGNAPVRQAVMQRMQQTYGNRATHRYIQRRAAVQRHPMEEGPHKEEEERPQPVQTMREATAVQRQPDGAAAQPPAGGAAPAAGPPGAAGATPAQGVIVDDAAQDLKPGQMKRSAFIAQLRSAVEAAAAEAVAGTPYAEMVRPELEKQLGQYTGLSAQALESTIRQQVPGAASATTAEALIPAVAARVRETVRAQMPQGAVAGVLTEGAAVVADVAQGAANAVSSVVGMFFKARDGGPRDAGSGAAAAAQLQSGAALPAGVRSGLEAAYTADFSGVRVHTDAGAAQLADSYNARAFTVGQDIAFGSGEYQPGTLVGDALIAHELAHVVQQGQGTAGQGVLQKGAEGEAGLEEDADRSAVGAVLSLWGGARTGLTNVAQNAVPALRSGLRLQRCARDAAPATTPPTLTADPKRFDNIRAQLARSATGAAALATCNKYNVTMQFGAPGGGGGFKAPPTNTMFMDPTWTDSFLITVVVHEANHARYYHEGLTANTNALIQSLPREEYVNRMLAEETESTILQIEAKMELEGGSAEMAATGVRTEPEYRAAYNASVTTQRAAKPTATDAEVRPAAREAGRAAVLAAFKSGRVTVSIPPYDPYPTYYGKAWDDRHKT